MEFVRPSTLDQAVALLDDGQWQILAGGTDFYPSLGEQPPSGNVLDVTAVDGLRKISEDEAFWSIGAGVTWTDLIKADLPDAFDGLKLAAREIGSVQIQNRATLVGNICNASPAADGVPPLLTLNAIIETVSVNGVSQTPLSEFICGNRHTKRARNELVSKIVIPKSSTGGKSHFLKLGARKYLVISISMVAVRVVCDNEDYVTDAAISVGSCSLVAKRLSALEADLRGKKLNADLRDVISEKHFIDLAPIDDVRSTKTYRMAASVELVKRAIGELCEPAA